MMKPRDYTSATAVTAQLAVVAIPTVAQVRLANLTVIMRGATLLNYSAKKPAESTRENFFEPGAMNLSDKGAIITGE
jgi:hypothetical protein